MVKKRLFATFQFDTRWAEMMALSCFPWYKISIEHKIIIKKLRCTTMYTFFHKLKNMPFTPTL